VILGAGLTGLSAALHLAERSFVLAERDGRPGGAACSHRREGHTFDITGHWLHLRDPRIQSWVAELFEPGEWVEVQRRTSIFSHGVRLAYPFQANLHGLPLEIVQECLVGFVEAREAAARGEQEASSFEAFAVARFGKGIARHFFVPYNTKLWGMHPDQLTADWVSRFIPVPDVAQVIGGALGLTQEGLGYNASFRYPKSGGIDALPRAMHQALQGRNGEIYLDCAMEEIDTLRRRVKLSDTGDWLGYSRLISSIPLPELIARIPSAPGAVRAATKLLRWVSWRYLDIATKNRPPCTDHWIYVPEPEYPFFRVGIYSNALLAMAADGGGSLYVELSDREAPLDLPLVLAGLEKIGAITSTDDLRFCEERRVNHAYVIFDDNHAAATRTILDWLRSVGIRSCGRYGSWTYNSMEDCMIEGILAADWAEDRTRA